MNFAARLNGPVFVAGPPGVGKSTLSRRAAKRLGVPLLDTDEEVERRTGRAPADLIASASEARLRAEEHDVVTEVGPAPSLVALGGGAWIDERTRHEVRARGPVIGLVAPTPELWRRISSDANPRPLAATLHALDRLVAERSAIYERTDLALATDADADQVCTALAEAAAGVRFLSVPAGAVTSRVLVGRGLARAAASAVSQLEPLRPALFIEDEGAPRALRDAYADALSSQVGPFVRVPLAGGESVKSWDGLGALLETALASGCGRQSVVIGLGGGAVCDLAATAAGLLGRGAPLVLVPTTLLGQVDAAIGGKTAVNLGATKNPVGLFHPAGEVIVDLDFLASLDEAHAAEGRAEMYKTALLAGEDAMTRLLEEGATIETITAALQTKGRIVSADPHERGLRKTLNLGHTWGHAVEAASNHALSHGASVAIGLAFIARLSERRGMAATGFSERVTADLKALGLPTHTPGELLEAALTKLRADKKGDREAVDLIVLRSPGEVDSMTMAWHELEEELRNLEVMR